MRKLLTELCHPKQWKTIASKDLLSQGYPVYGANGLIGYWRDYNHNSDVLTIGCRGTCGALNIIGGKSYINGNAMCLDELSHDIYIRYLYYYLRWYDLRKIITGTTIPQITIQGLQKVWVDYPSIKKQSEIVYVLDKVNLIIDYYQQQLQRLDDLVKARFVEMFENISYPTERFSRFIESLTSGSRGWAKYCVDDGSEWFITIKNVKNCCISTNNMQPINAPRNAEAIRTKVKEGDLLISITADLGRTGVVSKEIAEHGAYINQHLTCIRVDRKIINPLFIAYYLDSPAGKMQFKAKNQSAVKAGLNFEAINSLMIKVPPIELQNEFETFVQQVDKSKFVESIHVLKLIKEAIAKEVSHDRIR